MKRVLYLLPLLPLLLMVDGCARIRPPKGVAAIERTMEATGYCRCGKCCGWHRSWGRPIDNSSGRPKKVGRTANGTMARKGTIAADTSRYPFGTIMYIDGYGYGRVEDRGGAIKGERIDLFFGSHRQALQWGRKSVRVKIWPARKSR